MTLSTQLYANNASSTLAGSIISSGTSLAVAVGEGAKFPSPTTGQYFLLTLEVGTTREIVQVTAVSVDTFTIVRGQEGTAAANWSAGTFVEMRVTRDTLARFARLQDRVAEITTLDLLTPPNVSDSNSYLCHTLDDGGGPITAVKNDNFSWGFPSHLTALVNNQAISAGTTTSITCAALLGLLTPASPPSGKYIIQFRGTTANLSGTARIVTGVAGNVISFLPALPVTPVAGTDAVNVYKSNYSAIQDSIQASNNSLIYAIVFAS